MAISVTTDWSKKRYIMFVVFFVSALLASTVATGVMPAGKQKRQLFREHLLPQHGGRIPDGALEPQRLLINKISQHGFYSPDGYHIDQRTPDRHHSFKRPFPNLLKVNVYPDNNRYVAPAGGKHLTQSVDTTYLIRKPINFVLYPPLKYYSPLPFIPQHSLKILREFKYQKKNNQNAFNEVLNTEEFPAKILSELAPYLRKIHETD